MNPAIVLAAIEMAKGALDAVEAAQAGNEEDARIALAKARNRYDDAVREWQDLGREESDEQDPADIAAEVLGHDDPLD